MCSLWQAAVLTGLKGFGEGLGIGAVLETPDYSNDGCRAYTRPCHRRIPAPKESLGIKPDILPIPVKVPANSSFQAPASR